MAGPRNPNAHEALQRLRRALEDAGGERAPSSKIEQVLHRFLNRLPGEQALLVERRLQNLARAVEQLGPKATLDEISELARSYDRQLN